MDSSAPENCQIPNRHQKRQKFFLNAVMRTASGIHRQIDRKLESFCNNDALNVQFPPQIANTTGKTNVPYLKILTRRTADDVGLRKNRG